MLITRSMHPKWLSNTWLIADREGGQAAVIDTGGPLEPILRELQARRLELTHVLCTHHHYDHVDHNADFREQFGCVVCAHALEAEQVPATTTTLADGEEVRIGELTVRALHVPGHTAGQLAFLVNERALFTGDTLFRGSVGGTRAPGHTTFDDLRHSLLDVLFELPHETEVFPGHMEATSLGREWRDNPFVAAFRSESALPVRGCVAYGEPAQLLLEAPDYDGGTKCWVRFEGSGQLDVVPGSRVTKRSSS